MLKKTIVLGLVALSASVFLYAWIRGCSPPLSQLFPEAASDVAGASPPSHDHDLENFQSLDQLLVSLQNKSQIEIEQAQKARLMAKIEQLAAENAPPSALSDAFYGPHWKAKVDRYKRLVVQREFITVASIVLGFLGAAAMILVPAYVAARTLCLHVCALLHSVRRKRQ